VWPARCGLSSFTIVFVFFIVVEKNPEANNACLAVMALQRVPKHLWEVCAESLLKAPRPLPHLERCACPQDVSCRPPCGWSASLETPGLPLPQTTPTRRLQPAVGGLQQAAAELRLRPRHDRTSPVANASVDHPPRRSPNDPLTATSTRRVSDVG